MSTSFYGPVTQNESSAAQNSGRVRLPSTDLRKERRLLKWTKLIRQARKTHYLHMQYILRDDDVIIWCGYTERVVGCAKQRQRSERALMNCEEFFEEWEVLDRFKYIKKLDKSQNLLINIGKSPGKGFKALTGPRQAIEGKIAAKVRWHAESLKIVRKTTVRQIWVISKANRVTLLNI